MTQLFMGGVAPSGIAALSFSAQSVPVHLHFLSVSHSLQCLSLCSGATDLSPLSNCAQLKTLKLESLGNVVDWEACGLAHVLRSCPIEVLVVPAAVCLASVSGCASLRMLRVSELSLEQLQCHGESHDQIPKSSRVQH